MSVRLAAGLVIGASLVAACTAADDESPAATDEAPATTTAEQPVEEQEQPTTEPIGDDGSDGENGNGPPAESGLEGAIGEASDLVLSWFNGATFDEATYDAAFDVRRRILDDEVASMPLPPLSSITSVTDPVDVETLELFASAADLCRMLTRLAGSIANEDVLIDEFEAAGLLGHLRDTIE